MKRQNVWADSYISPCRKKNELSANLLTSSESRVYSALQQNIQEMRRRNFKEQGKLLKAYFRMMKKFDAVIWNLYKHFWIFCFSAEYKSFAESKRADVSSGRQLEKKD